MAYFERRAKNSFDGFVNYFTQNNIKVSDYFTAEGSTADGWGSPSVLLDYSKTGNSSTDQWGSRLNEQVVTFTLKCNIYLTHYRLRSRLSSIDNMPVSWYVEGSVVKGSWTKIDTKEDRTELLTLGSSYTYACDKPMTLKYIRFTETNTTHDKHFHLSRIEFFGRMKPENCPLPVLPLIYRAYSCGRKHQSVLFAAASMIIVFIS